MKKILSPVKNKFSAGKSRMEELTSIGSLLIACVVAIACFHVGTGLHASTFTWTKLIAGNASGSWTNAANWSGGTLPTTTSDTASFNTLDITADSTVTLDGSQSINTVIFGNTDASPAANWLLNPGSFVYSTLTLGGTTPTITINALGSSKNAIINAPLAGSTAWTKNGYGTLTLALPECFTCAPELPKVSEIDGSLDLFAR